MERKAGYFMSAGSHSTEEVERLLDQLEAEHQVYRYANRDPMGMNGFAYMLSPDRGEESGLLSWPKMSNQFSGNVVRRLARKTKRYCPSSVKYGWPTHGLYGKLNRGEA